MQVLYVEDKAWQSRVISFWNVLYFARGVLQNAKSFGKYTVSFSELLVITVPDNMKGGHAPYYLAKVEVHS